MVKRKCGTCRHFKDGGIAGSGWCQHQARKDIQHMVLVRKTELACRNSWDQDLWELADQPIDIHTSTDIPMPLSGGESQDIPVARAELPTDDSSRAGEMFTDRITSISMPTRSQLRRGSADADRDIDPVDDSDLGGSRSSVREARKRRQEQRHLERKKHQETVLKRVDDLLDTDAPADEVDRGLAKTRAIDGPMTTSHDQRASRPTERDVPRSQTPRTERPNPARAVEAIEFSATPPTFRGDRPRKAPQPDPSPVNPAAKMNGAGPGASVGNGHTEPLPAAAEVHEAVNKSRVSTARDSETALPRRSAPTRDQPARRSEVARPTPPEELPPAVEPRPTTWYTGAGHAPRPDTPIGGPAPYAVDPIDLARDLKAVRRCCATCRDFKQVGDGRTGWCNNPYAFSERRMVESNEIACRSSLGVWWLPHDDLWLEQADTTHHGRPTPLLDDLVGSVAAGRQGIGQRSS